MKVRFSLIMAIIGIELASCGDDNDSEKWLTGKSQNFSINSNLRRETLPVLKARDVWTATVGYGTSDQGWLTLDKTEGEAGTVELTAFIAANPTKKYRSATVTVTCHKETVKFQFSQAGMTFSAISVICCILISKQPLGLQSLMSFLRRLIQPRR